MPIPAHPRDDVRYPVTERLRLAKRVFEDLAVLEKLLPAGGTPTSNSKQMPAQAAAASGACLAAALINSFTEDTTRTPSCIFSIFAAAFSVLRRPSWTWRSISCRAFSASSSAPVSQTASGRSSLDRTALYAATSFGSSSQIAS